MHLVASVEKRVAVPAEGLATWLLGAWKALRTKAGPERRKHMRVVETLALDARHRLVLVSCEGERFLVGMGRENMGTIVRVQPESKGLGVIREQV